MAQDQRRLRSRPARPGRRGDPQILHEERLRRLPHHQHRCRLSGRQRSGLYRSRSRMDEGRAVSRLRRERDLAHPAVSTALRFSASSHCTPATSTTPPRSKRRSRRSPANSRARATPFPTCARTASATTATHQIARRFTVDDGPKVYIERIDIVGNTRTRDYVIRREFDIGEGDPYNHAMIEQRRAPAQQSRLLQEGAHLDPAGLDARSRDRRPSRSRISRPARSACQRRLFDDRPASSPKSPSPRPTFSAAANM